MKRKQDHVDEESFCEIPIRKKNSKSTLFGEYILFSPLTAKSVFQCGVKGVA